jgi:L-rhamnose-H+ transport protein
MNLTVISGIFLIALGAFSSGSFAVPFGKIKNWNWETYWMVFSSGAYILFPLVSCFVLAPGFVTVIRSTSSATILTVFLLGALYGVGNLSFGLALRYLGLSLGYALSLGIMLGIGTLIPPLIDGRLKMMMESHGGELLIWGIIVAFLGIAVSAWSGIQKDRQVSEVKKRETVSEFNIIKGVIAALVVGVTGSAMSLGFEQAVPLSDTALRLGVNPLFTMMPVMLVLLSGTFVTTVIWCFYMGLKNKSLKNYTTAGFPGIQASNYLFGLLAGLLWFVQFIFYGMGKSKMGPFTFTSWGILMALTIVFATVWGLIRNEWKGVSLKVYALMILSLVIIIISSFMIGVSGS